MRRLSSGYIISITMLSVISLPPASFAQELEEVVVTAQRRAESIQDVSISITSFSGETLQKLKILNPVHIAYQTPGVNIKNQFSEEAPVFTFRGIGTNDPSSVNSPTVSAYLDGVLIPFHWMLGGEFYDLERIEILKGPQGTLYGSNNTGGAINLIAKKPEQEFSGFGRMEYGSYKTFEFEGGVGGGLTENLAGRASLVVRDRAKGHQRNRYFDLARTGEQERFAGRVQLLWEPTDDLDMHLTIHGSSHEDDHLNYVNISTQDPAFAFGGPPSVLCGPAMEGRRSEGECTNFRGYYDDDGDDHVGDFNNALSDEPDGRLESRFRGLGANIKITWDLPRFTITSTTSYDEFERDAKEDTDQGPALMLEAVFEDDIWVFSQEVLVSSDDSWPIDWLGGVFYTTNTNDGGVSFLMRDLLATDAINAYDHEVEAIAGFAHLGWEFADNWKINGGVRVTHETREMTQSMVDLNTFGISLFTQPASFCAVVGICGIPGLGFEGLSPAPPTFGRATLASLDGREIDVTDVSGEIGLEWKPLEDLLLYAKFSKGFKSGGFNSLIVFSQVDAEPFEDEVVLAWEGGFKSTLPAQGLQLNGALFYMEWKDFQAQIVQGTGAFPVTNAGDAEILGFELSVDWSPPALSGLDIILGLSYLDTEVTMSNPDLAFSLKGNKLHDAPEWTFNGVGRYSVPLPMLGGSNLYFQVDFNWNDDFFWEAKNVPPIVEHAYWLVNTRVGLSSQDDRWDVAFWTRNVFDAEYMGEIFDFTATTGTGLGIAGFPRELGVSVNYSWD